MKIRSWLLPAIVALYFSLFLLPHVFPALGGSAAYFYYLISLWVPLGVLLLLAIFGWISIVRARRAGASAPPARYTFVRCAITAWTVFVMTSWLAPILPRALPTGSDGMAFDSGQWRDVHSTDVVLGDITPRQKMLADVIKHSLPGKSRGEIEALLGPSLDTPYFASTKRDMIYVLGAERDSFMAIDSEWLLIWLDNDGRFKRCKITVD